MPNYSSSIVMGNDFIAIFMTHYFSIMNYMDVVDSLRIYKLMYLFMIYKVSVDYSLILGDALLICMVIVGIYYIPWKVIMSLYYVISCLQSYVKE